MFQASINELRRYNGVGPVQRFDERMSHFCFLHARAMAEREKVYHADLDFLEGWAEAVGCHDRIPYMQDAIRAIIFTLFGRSDLHRNILIYSNEMAIGQYESDRRLYVTIRGR